MERSRVRRERLPMWLAIVIAMFCGAAISIQSRINGELGKELGDGFVAAAISFGSGLLILAIGLTLSRRGRHGLVRIGGMLRSGTLTWWYVLGGSAGALLVLSQGLTEAILGVALFIIALVAGQIVSGLLLDRVGIGPGGRRQITPPRVVGAFITLVAVTWAVSAQLHSDVPLWMLCFPIASGLAMGWQQAVNGQVRVRAESAYTATFINFLIGTSVLVIAMLIHSTFAGWPRVLPSDPWLYLGGVIGCAFIAGSSLIVQTTGVLLLGLGTIAGQLVAALLLGIFLPASSQPIAWTTIAGTLLALVAVVVAGSPWRQLRTVT